MIKASLGRQVSLIRTRAWVICALGLFLATSAGRAAERQVLHNHVPQAVSRLRALRHLEATNVVQLAIGLPLRNQGELTNLLQDLYNPDSPNYRQGAWEPLKTRTLERWSPDPARLSAHENSSRVGDRRSGSYAATTPVQIYRTDKKNTAHPGLRAGHLPNHQ